MAPGNIRLEIPHVISRPEWDSDIKEVGRIQRAIEQLHIIRTRIVQPMAEVPPLVRADYAAGEEPQAYWSRWLLVRVYAEPQVGWKARLYGFNARERILYFTPARDMVELFLARKAAEYKLPRVTELCLGVLWPESHYIRRFPFVRPCRLTR